MTGLPWYAHSIADYETKTAHLSMLEHGAYRLMLDHYYKSQKPLPENPEHVHRICRAFAEHEQSVCCAMLQQFFVLEHDGWHNKRADEEIARMSAIRIKRQKAANAKHRKRKLRHALADDVHTKRTSDAPTVTVTVTESLEIDKSISPSKAAHAGFEEFWTHCPKKVGKGEAKKAYARALTRTAPETILTGIQRYAASRANQDEQYTAHPATWLNRDGWLDETKPCNGLAGPVIDPELQRLQRIEDGISRKIPA